MKRILLCVLIISTVYSLSEARIASQISLFSDSYISPAYEATLGTSFNYMGMSLKSDEFSDEKLRLDVSGAISFEEPLLNFLNVTELYYSTEINQNERLWLGRKKYLWSELDAQWNMSIWEPVFKWNPLTPQRQGLSGLFWQVERPEWSITIFASALYIPDQGPSFLIEDGQFMKGNPWFQNPPDSIHIFHESTEADYRLNRPNESDVIFQASYGASLMIGDPQKLLFRASHLFKPANQLALGYQGRLNIPNDKGIIELLPVTYHHSVSGVDMTYRYDFLRFGYSVNYDQPLNDFNLNEDWTIQNYSPALLTSPFIELLGQYWSLNLSHLRIYDGQVVEIGALADANRAPLASKYAFYEATQLSLIGRLSLAKSREMSGRLTTIYSEENQFTVVKGDLRIRFSNLWQVSGEIQLVQSRPITDQNKNDIAQFVNNDRFMFGVSYAL